LLKRIPVIPVFPLARMFPCSKELLVLARNLQGNKIYKEMARKNTRIKGNCKDSVTYTSCKSYTSKNQLINSI
jgi:hypothetical protein